MKSKFRVGNRVINNEFGAGTVIGVGIFGNPLVEFDNARDGFHDGNGSEIYGTKGKKGHCWYIKNIKPLSNQAIVIYPKGLETIALLKEGKKVIKQTSAKCNPSDTFDFNIGAKLAFSRLVGGIYIGSVDMAIDTIREVKRPAKVGEWIKVVDDKGYKYGNYQLGDIMKVDRFYCSSDVIECEFNDTECRLTADEYVVLENYQPDDKPEATIKALANYTDKELIDELAKRWEDKQ